MFTFGANDTYKISLPKKNQKLLVDYKILVRLYTPIIGSVATSLYLTLESESTLNKGSRNQFYISRLYKLLQLDNKRLNNAMETLKEYGLLKYKANSKKANDYLFVLNPTKEADDFFADEKLNQSLQVTVDNTYYEQVYNYFINSNINEDEYVDIDEIRLANELTEEQFYQQLLEKYPIIASNGSAITNNEKREIDRLKKLFALNYSEIENAILNSFGYEGDMIKIDLQKLNEFIQSKYKEVQVKKDGDEMLVQSFESEKPISYYKKLSGRNALLPREVNMINELLDEYDITDGVLNVVINYYFKYGQKNIVAPKNYFVKVIEEMIVNNVKTTIDAINYFRNRNKRMNSYKNLMNDQKTISNEPIMNEKQIKEETKKQSNTKVPSKEEIEELRKLLRG